MNWFFIALLTPVLHAAANHIDKHLISKYFRNATVGSLVIFTSFFALIALPFIFFINPHVVAIHVSKAVLLVLNGILTLSYLIFYFYALAEDETSLVAPFFELTPVFGFIFGFFVLGEVLHKSQILAGLLIIAGATILSLDFSGPRLKVKRKLAYLMTASSFLYALTGVIFKFFALTEGFTTSLFWGLIGQGILGFLLYALVSSYRTSFHSVIKENSGAILGLNLLNGLLVLLGDIIFYFALLLAPAAIVLAVNGTQPLFVFLFGVILTLFFPSFGKESLDKKALVQKLLGIGTVVIGAILLS